MGVDHGGGEEVEEEVLRLQVSIGFIFNSAGAYFLQVPQNLV